MRRRATSTIAIYALAQFITFMVAVLFTLKFGIDAIFTAGGYDFDEAAHNVP